MKKLLNFSTLAFTAIIIFSACKKDDDDNSGGTTTTPTTKQRITGQWIGVTEDNSFTAFGASFTFPTDISNTVVEFNSGASYRETTPDDLIVGTWTTASNNRLVINGLIYNIELISDTQLHYSTQTSLDTLGTTVALTTTRKLER